MDITPLLNYISRHISLTTEEEAFLAAKVRYRKYLKGQFVVQQGDICRCENFVLSGCLKTFYVDPEGQEHIVSFAIENWWAADLGSFISRTPARFNVQCIEDTELAQFPYDTLEQLYLDIPKLERFFRIILQKAYVASQDRLVGNFSLPARERYAEFRRQYPGIEQRVPQYMVASYLGITREFLSRIKNTPERKC